MNMAFLIRVIMLPIVFFAIGLHQLITKKLFFGYSRKYTEESMQRFARISGVLIMLMGLLALISILNRYEYIAIPAIVSKVSMVVFIILAIAFTLLFMMTLRMRPEKELKKMREEEEAAARAKAQAKARRKAAKAGAKKGDIKVNASRAGGYAAPNPKYTPSKRSSGGSKKKGGKKKH